jgi:hypothetical protein
MHEGSTVFRGQPVTHAARAKMRFLKRLPLYMRAPLEALQFESPDYGLLAQLTDDDWKRTLRFCDRAQLTLPLSLRCREKMPEAVRARTDRNIAGNAERWGRLQPVYREVADRFAGAGIEFAVLKGFSHCPRFVPDPRWRPQYDMDLLLEKEQVLPARDVAKWLGYEPLGASNGRVDHLPTMIRKTGWQWRGDLFDPEIPFSLELHFRLWDARTELFKPDGLEQFWERRERRQLEELSFISLHAVDAVAYSALHSLRHLLRGDLKVFHIYELALMLDRSAGDDSFWTQWREWHEPSLRRVEAICFALAQRWFACGIPEAAAEEIASLPLEVTRWLEMHALSPLMARPNKDEMWLHWSLLDSPGTRWSMLRRRLLPITPPGPVDSVHVRESDLTWRLKVRRKWRYANYAASRVRHHVGTLPGIALSAMRWFLGGLSSVADGQWRRAQ